MKSGNSGTPQRRNIKSWEVLIALLTALRNTIAISAVLEIHVEFMRPPCLQPPAIRTLIGEVEKVLGEITQHKSGLVITRTLSIGNVTRPVSSFACIP